MAKEGREFEQEFIATVEDKTGKSLQTWLDDIAASGETKTNSIIKWIKSTYGLNHLQATILTGIYLNDGKPVFDYDVMFAKLFEGNEAQKSLYDLLAAKISARIASLLFIPTKSYVSLEEERVIGCIKINKTNLRVGLDLGDEPFDGVTQAAKGLGAMPNIAHMIEITSESDVTDALVDYVVRAYERRH